MRSLLAAAVLSALATLFVGTVGLGQSPDKPLAFDEYKKAVDHVSIKDHTMPINQFRKLHGRPNLVILDLRSEVAYKQGHIKGAINMGADITAQRLKEFIPNKNATVVLYCTNTFMPSRMISLNFASLPQVIALGYPNTFVLEDLWHKSFAESTDFRKGPLWEAPNPAK